MGVITARLISLFALILFLDILFSLTYNIHTSNKLSQLEKITLLKNEYRADSLKESELHRIETEVFNKKHYSEYFPFLISKISSLKIIAEEDVEKPKISVEMESNRSIFWMSFSSNFLLVLALPFVIFLPVYDKDSRKGNGITGWISSIIVLSGTITLCTWIAYQIPIILNNTIWNYILNLILHCSFWGLVISFNSKNKTP